MAEKTLKEKTAKGLMWGSVSNGAQLILGTLFGIFLARILSPSDYGMVGLLAVFSQTASILQDSGFRTALANRREIVHEDYNAVFWFNITTSCTLYILLFFLAPLITDFYLQSDAATNQDLSELTPLARFSFLGFVIASLGTAHYAYLFRTLQVKQKAIITIISLTASSTIGLIMALTGYAYWGLATQGIAFTTCNTVLFWYFSKWRPTLPVSFRPLKEMFGFSSKILVTDICNNINGNILSVMLGRFYAVNDVGLYNQAYKWTNMASTTVLGTIKDVAQPVLRNVEKERERHKRVFRKMLRFNAFMTFTILFGLALISRDLLLITVTEKWLSCVPLMLILCIGAFTFPLQYLCTNLVITKERSDLVLWNTIGMGITQLGAVFFSYPYGIRTMVCIYTVINIMWLIVWFYFVRREIDLRLRETFFDLAPYAAVAAITMATTALITSPIEHIYLLLGLKIIIAVLLYATLMWVSGSVIYRECMKFFLSVLKARF